MQPAALDTRTPIETPEGIDLLLRAAGLLPRSLAFAVDLLLRGAILLALFLLLKALGEFGTGVFMLALFLVNWWYMVLFEVLHQGRTPGKQVMGLQVVHDDGTPIGWTASVLRNLLRAVDMLPLGYAAGAFTCLQHPQFKRLGDLAAGTMVIYRDELSKKPSIPQDKALPSPIALTLAEQRAVMAFAERQGQLSPERAQELATILVQPLQLDPQQAIGQLNGIARTLLGASPSSATTSGGRPGETAPV